MRIGKNKRTSAETCNKNGGTASSAEISVFQDFRSADLP